MRLAYALTLTGRLRLPFHGISRQVPKLRWDDYGPASAGALFGLKIGTGIATFVPQPSYWVLLAWIALVPDPLVAAMAMIVFALAMTASVWIGSLFATLDFDIDDVSLWAIRYTNPLGRLHVVTMVSTAFLALLTL